MTAIEMTIMVKAGPVAIDLSSNDGDILHHISVPEFINKVLELANYVGPTEEPPVLPTPPPPPAAAALEAESPRNRSENSMPSVEEFEHKRTREARDALPDGPPQGDKVSRIGSKDPTLEKFYDEDVK